MNGSEKIAVSLPAGLTERARQAVRRGYAASVSAYVAAALEEKAKLDELSVLLDEMLAESGGPLTAAEKRAADRSLGVLAGKSAGRVAVAEKAAGRVAAEKRARPSRSRQGRIPKSR